MVFSFNSLPIEVQRMVLKASLNNPLCTEYLLVCKNWNSYYQQKLYSKVQLDRFLCLVKFLDSLKNNQLLGALVKKIKLNFQLDPGALDQNLTVAKIFKHLINLEIIIFSSGEFFRLLSDALLMDELPRLNFIVPPANAKGINNYETCAIVLRRCLLNLHITDWCGDGDPYNRNGNLVRFHRLFSKLDQFKELRFLEIEKKTDNIADMLEKIAHNCPMLRYLVLKVTEILDNQVNLIDITGVTNLAVLPAPHMKTLKFLTNIFDHSQLVLYVIHKFPNLQNLSILGATKWTSAVEESTLKKFLDYVSDIKDFLIQSSPCNQMSIIDLIGPFWKKLSHSRMLYIEFKYNSHASPQNLELGGDIGISKSTFFSSSYQTGFNHTHILEKHGCYIHHLTIYGIRTNKPQQLLGYTLFEVLIFQPLKHCVKLDGLLIQSCTLSGLDLSRHRPIQKRTLDNVIIEDCFLKDESFFNSLSALFSHVTYMELSKISLVNIVVTKGFPIMNIDMSETEFDILFLSMGPVFSIHGKSIVLVKLTLEDRESDYFKLNLNSARVLQLEYINEENRLKRSDCNNCFIFNLKCKDLNRLALGYNEEQIHLSVRRREQ